MDLNELIARSKQHDGNAFRQLVESHQSMIYALAFRLLCNEEDAKDAVQETFLRAWNNLKHFDADRAFGTWLYAIATNHCYDRLQSARRHGRSLGLEDVQELFSSENAEKKLLDAELGSLIATWTDGLSPKQRVVFTLSDLEDLSTDEIVQITGMTAAQIKSNLFLARQVLRKKLKPYQDGR